MDTREKPSPEAIEACIARVIAAEREAQASIESAQARASARAIAERAEARLAAARQSVEARIARHQVAADARVRGLQESLAPAEADEGRLDAARGTSLERLLEVLPPQADLTDVDRAARTAWSRTVAEATTWMPAEWRAALHWCDSAATSAPGSNPTLLPSLAQPGWRKRWPAGSDESGLEELAKLFADHLARFRIALPHEASALRRGFEARLLALMRRHPVQSAIARHGLAELRLHPAPALAAPTLRSESRSVMGVRLLAASLAQLPREPEVPDWGSPEARAGHAAFAALLALAPRVGSSAGNLERLSEEYRRSIRRARALDDVLIPEAARELSAMETALEDLEREDAIAMRLGAGAGM